MVLVLVLFILMGVRTLMDKRSLYRELEEARSQSISREASRIDRPKKIDKNIYGLDIIKAYEIHSKLEYYVEKEVERKKERKPDPDQDSQDQDGQNINTKLEDKYEIVKEKVKKKAYKYLVKLEIRN